MAGTSRRNSRAPARDVRPSGALRQEVSVLIFPVSTSNVHFLAKLSTRAVSLPLPRDSGESHLSIVYRSFIGQTESGRKSAAQPTSAKPAVAKLFRRSN